MKQSSVARSYEEFADDGAALPTVCPHCGEVLSPAAIRRNDSNEPVGA